MAPPTIGLPAFSPTNLSGHQSPLHYNHNILQHTCAWLLFQVICRYSKYPEETIIALHVLGWIKKHCSFRALDLSFFCLSFNGVWLSCGSVLMYISCVLWLLLSLFLMFLLESCLEFHFFEGGGNWQINLETMETHISWHKDSHCICLRTIEPVK